MLWTKRTFLFYSYLIFQLRLILSITMQILLCRLETVFGIHSTARQWFRSYLLERNQYVVVTNSTSSSFLLMCGVPQGSLPWPVLFVLYNTQLVIVLFSEEKQNKNKNPLTGPWHFKHTTTTQNFLLSCVVHLFFTSVPIPPSDVLVRLHYCCDSRHVFFVAFVWGCLWATRRERGRGGKRVLSPVLGTKQTIFGWWHANKL